MLTNVKSSNQKQVYNQRSLFSEMTLSRKCDSATFQPQFIEVTLQIMSIPKKMHWIQDLIVNTVKCS